MRAVFLFTLIACALPYAYAQAQEFNAGFVQGLWYSRETVFAEDTVRIYVAIRNNTGSDLTGTVEFFDNDKRIGQKTVQALDGRIIESWADWNPGYGEHTLSSTLSSIELHTVGSTRQAVEVTAALAEDVLFVDYDTDGDGIGNADDHDDDGDSVTDEQETQDGTDPLVFNEISDEKDSADEKSGTTRDVHDTPEGLERFLKDSPAEHALSSFTRALNLAQRQVDHYREKREAKLTALSDTAASGNTGESGRDALSSSTASNDTASTIIAGIISAAGTAFSLAYTLLLAALSFVLSYPLLVQLGILFGILFVLIKTASRFGKRPNS